MSGIESRFLGRPIYSLAAVPTECDLIFELLTVVTMMITVLLIVMSWSLHITKDRNLQVLVELRVKDGS
jgi:hypothetical protein